MTGRQLVTRRFFLVAVLVLTISTAEVHAADSLPIIVKLTQASQLTPVLNRFAGVLVDSIPGSDIYLINVPDSWLIRTTLGLPTYLLQLIGIDWLEINLGVAQPDLGQLGIFERTGTAGADWYKNQPAMQLIKANQAQAYATGFGVVVADINSKVDVGHPALIGHLTGGYDFVGTRPEGSTALNQSDAGFLDQSDAGFLDQSDAGFLDDSGVTILNQSDAGFLDHGPAYSHGTLCAGIIAVMAPNAGIMPLRAFDDQGRADLFILAKAIRHAVTNNAQVINMSFGALGQSKALKSSIDYAKSKGVILVASAGNNNSSTPQYPAAYSGVLTTAATKLDDVKASFSNYGGYVAVSAPGAKIISAYPGGYYAMVSGTSFSAPEVAATAALIRSIRIWGVSSSITSTSVDIDTKNPGYQNKLGSGRIDVLRAVQPN